MGIIGPWFEVIEAGVVESCLAEYGFQGEMQYPLF